MGRLWCHQPYGGEEEVSIFSCKNCKLYKNLNVQLFHIKQIKYWEIIGPLVTGVFVNEARNITSDKIKRSGFFFNQGNTIVFDPYVVDDDSVTYYNVDCKICKTHVGYEIPTFGGFVIFYSTLF